MRAVVFALLLLSLAPLSACTALERGAMTTYSGWTKLMNSSIRLFTGYPPGTDDAPDDVQMVEARGSYVYVLDVEGGVVIIDAGFEADAAAVRSAVDGREIFAVLITHSHPDHSLGAKALGAPTYVGAADLPLWRGDQHYRAFFSHAAQHVIGSPPLPEDVRTVHDGEHLRFGGETFRALACPGHTPGSTCWRWRDIAFTGDGLVNIGGDALTTSPFTVTDDREQNRASFRRLLHEDISAILDAHYGRTDDPRELIAAAIARHRAEAP